MREHAPALDGFGQMRHRDRVAAGQVQRLELEHLGCGAAIGEYLAQKDQSRAVKVGLATWVGIMVGLIAKVVLAFTMVGIFVAALLI